MELRRRWGLILILGILTFGMLQGASAQGSLLPDANLNETGLTTLSCQSLRNAIIEDPRSMEGKYLALKIRCGRMMFTDLPHYFKHALGFALNIIGTLAVIAVIRAGYIYMLTKGKDLVEGKKAVAQVIIGLLIASLSFTAAQLVVRFLFAIDSLT